MNLNEILLGFILILILFVIIYPQLCNSSLSLKVLPERLNANASSTELLNLNNSFSVYEGISHGL